MLTLNFETEAGADLSRIPAETGTKGDPVALGQIILTALTSVTVVALFGVLKAYFERKPSLKVSGGDSPMNSSIR